MTAHNNASYAQLETQLYNINQTLKYLEQIPTHLRNVSQRETIKDMRGARLTIKRRMANHPDKPKQLELFPFPVK